MLDSGCTNHMTGERRMFTSFEKNDYENDCITFGDNSQDQVLGFGKIAILPNIQFLKFLLNRWTTIYCPFHNFVRLATTVCSPIRV
jgi:hypothetical protein